MQMNEENKSILINFISQKISEGETIEQIKLQLIQMGWSEEDVNLAYMMASASKGSMSTHNFQQPQLQQTQQQVQQNNFSKEKKSTAGEVVADVISFVALGFIISSFITLSFSIINYFFEDAASLMSYYSEKYLAQTVNYAVAVVVVAFPIYYFSIKYWLASFRKDPEKKENRLTKFVTYLVLLISLGVLAGDLVTILYNFLQGELSTRFFLKSFIVFIASAGVFGFYYF